MKSIAALCLLAGLAAYIESACIHKNYGRGSTVCVCNQTQCDMLGKIRKQDVGIAASYESSKDGSRFLSTTHEFISQQINLTDAKRTDNIIVIDRQRAYQGIIGFGGAFTDATGINILSLEEPLRTQLLETYFSSHGADYNMGRVPIASCDFSTHEYSYDDEANDFELSHFSLTSEDTMYKIPFIHQAQKLRATEKLLLIASPWSAPAWMKTNSRMSGRGSLKGSPNSTYYKTWANYFVKFLDAYDKQNVSFWGITVQNEPSSGYLPMYPFQCMAMSPGLERDFLKYDLGPALASAGYGTDRLHVLILDDQRVFLPYWANMVLRDEEAARYVTGIAFHWYWNHIRGPTVLDETHYQHPGKFLLSTEACEGPTSMARNKVKLGSWSRAESYAHDIIQDLLHWTTGWIDWNLALDLQGGPNWAKNFVDSPIIVNATAQEFYKQPMYYALAHFSKFIRPMSKRIYSKQPKNVEVASFVTPENATVLVVLNRNSELQEITVVDPELGYFNYSIPAHAIQTYIWWRL
ncbi:lysosomal acid glucosylceramidase-like [Ornithodoros turicata]